MRVNAFTNPNLMAIEIPNSRSKLKGFNKNIVEGTDKNYKREHPIATINSSDSNSIKSIGSRSTYIKMSSISIEGLREAFLDWKSRLRTKDELKSANYSSIICVYWNGEGCFLKDQGIHFNKNLNTIIGGKGTGKSTIVETLRFIFNQEPKSQNAVKAYNEIIKDVFKSGSTIQVLVYSPDMDKYYLIERVYPGEPIVKSINEELLKQKGMIKDEEIINLPVNNIFNVEIYGQKEIYNIADDKSFQLKLIDRFLSKNFKKLLEIENILLGKLEENKIDLIGVKGKLNELEEYEKELIEIKQKKQKYIKLGIDKKLKTKRLYEDEKLILDTVLEKIKYIKEGFEVFYNELDLDTEFIQENKIKELLNAEIIRNVKIELESFYKYLAENKIEVENKLQGVQEKIEGIINGWKLIYQKQEDEYKKILNLLRKDDIPDPDEFVKIDKREKELINEVSKKDRTIDKKKELENDRKGTLDKLREVRLNKFKERKIVEEMINTDLKGILRINIEDSAIKDNLKKKILSYSTYENRLLSSQIDRMIESDNFNIKRFIESLKSGKQALIDDLGLTTNTAANLYRVIPEEDYYDIETMDFKSKTNIRLYVGPVDTPINERKDENFREIEHLSSGQKCTAILTLILLESQNPLIIDQPEDDLDNRYVVNDVITKLRAEKERRQFIIATHNANITISADSELILSLEANERNGWIDVSGSIDDKEIKDAVELILEGGREVFLLRKEKYGF